jgi:hypothetical protein
LDTNKNQSRHSDVVEKKKRTWEFVDISMLYNVISNVMDGFSSNSIVTSESLTTSHERHRMKILACLIGLTGTDFTRSLPHMSPGKIWEALSVKSIWFGLLRSFDYNSGSLVVTEACDILIANLYKKNFAKHTHGGPLKNVLSSLQSSKLAPRTKSQLPSAARIETTIKNINWLLIYWKCLSPIPTKLPETKREMDSVSIWDHSVCFPDAVAPEYGFKRAKSGGPVQWLDAT